MTKVYIIAEVGSVHDGSIGNAIEMVKLWSGAWFDTLPDGTKVRMTGGGADGIKFQDHRFEDVAFGQEHPNPRVREGRYEYYARTQFEGPQWNAIARHCREAGVDFIVSPFSVEAAKEQADRVTAFKVASGQVTNLELLRTLREIGKPVYLSSGMTTQAETTAAVRELGTTIAGLLSCTSEYPCAPEHVGLNWFQGYPFAFPTGLSDHTMGYAASLAAITLGARVIERHVTPSRYLYGSDAAHSLEPDEFRRFVREVRELEVMLANPVNKDELVKTPEMQRMRDVFLAR